MYKTAFAALLAGMLLLLSLGYLASALEHDERLHGGISWDFRDMRVVAGEGVKSGESLLLTMDSTGRAVVVVEGKNANLEALPFLRLTMENSPDAESTVIIWSTAQGNGKLQQSRIPGHPAGSTWISMAGEARWQGNAINLGIGLLGPPGGQLSLASIALLPPSLPHRVLAFLSNWTDFVPWQHFSINSHTGIRQQGSGPYPVPVIAALFFLSVSSYFLYLVVSRSGRRFDLGVIVVLFVGCWLILDLAWQARLVQQLDLTMQNFAGKNSPEKRNSSFDSDIFKFISAAKTHIERHDSRVFVTSTDDYRGMRSAYYLYPRNVFWQRSAEQLPEKRYLSKGDYIVLIQPASPRFDSSTQTLSIEEGDHIPVEPILSSSVGNLYRIL